MGVVVGLFVDVVLGLLVARVVGAWVVCRVVPALSELTSSSSESVGGLW